MIIAGGALAQIKGRIESFTGKLQGERNMKTEGAAETRAGKVENAHGGAEDQPREG